MTPQGRYGLIDDPETFDIMPFKLKAISVHWEFMFTRPMFETADMQRQSDILNEVASLIDAGKVKSTVAESFGTINAANLRKAHALLESGKSKGKIVWMGSKMLIQRLDQVIVVKANLEEMVVWYEAILGLHSGPRPNFPFGGAWLYSG